MFKRSSFLQAAAAAAALAIPTTFAAAGPVELVSQSRTLTGEVRQDPGASGGGQDQDTASASGFGVFQAEVDARVENDPGDGPPGSLDSFASGMVDSDIRDDGFDAEGSGGAGNRSSNDSFSTVSDLFNVVFDVTQSVRFDGDFTYQIGGGPGGTARVTLKRVGGDGETLVDSSFLSFFGDPQTLEVDEVLEAGRYQLATQIGLEKDDAGRSYEYDFGVALSATDDDGGGATPIPLPPAALAGLSVMGGAGLVGSIRKRLRVRRA